MDNYYEKYLKYKNKYLKNKNNTGSGILPILSDIIAIIELYNKAFNSYIVYRFRFPNAKPIITNIEGTTLVNLSNLVFEMKNLPEIKQTFNEYYYKDLTEANFDEIKDGEPVYERPKILFTLRQDTTKVIRNMLLLNADAKKQILQLKKNIRTCGK